MPQELCLDILLTIAFIQAASVNRMSAGDGSYIDSAAVISVYHMKLVNKNSAHIRGRMTCSVCVN